MYKLLVIDFYLTYTVVWLLCDDVADAVNEVVTRTQVPLTIIALYDRPDMALIVPLDIKQLGSEGFIHATVPRSVHVQIIRQRCEVPVELFFTHCSHSSASITSVNL